VFVRAHEHTAISKDILLLTDGLQYMRISAFVLVIVAVSSIVYHFSYAPSQSFPTMVIS
jgi:hypothetical protein